MTAIVWTISLVLIALTLAPMMRSAKWYVRVWEFPRLQLASCLAVSAAAQIVLGPTGAAGILLLVATFACLAWQAWQIHTYTPLYRYQSQPASAAAHENSVNLLIANVLKDNRNAKAFLQCVSRVDPDIVLAVETDRYWDRELAVLGAGYPYAVRHPLENSYGIHLFSRLPLRDVLLQDRVTRDIPSIYCRFQLRSGRWIDLYCVHPEPPVPFQDTEERDAELILVAKEVRRRGRPAIVCGDLNDVAWSHTTRLFQRISGMLDPRVGRGLFATFHARHWFARWPLDHVFHDPSFRLRRLEVMGYIGSDHFPIRVDLVHDPTLVGGSEQPAPDGGDEAEAAEKIAEGREAAAEDGRR